MSGSGSATVLDDLPEWIVVEEILVRLPPEDLLRCRAVRKCWHSATSTGKFMLDHHRRQPILPILRDAYRRLFVLGNATMCQQQLCPILRSYSYGYGTLHAALDGLLIVSHGDQFFVYNPVTRKCATLGMPQRRQGSDLYIAGFYRHQPSGEYRVLWVSVSHVPSYNEIPRTFYFVVAVGSNDTRCIRQGGSPRPTSSSPSLEMALRWGLGSSDGFPPVHHRGSLHWKLGKFSGCDDTSYIMVFDTTAETFRLICQPAQLRPEDLLFLEMDGTLALCRFSSDRDTIDVWVMQDYDTETWSFKHRITLSWVDPLPPADAKQAVFPRMVVVNEGELLIQFARSCVLRYGTDGKFLGYVKNEEDQEIGLWITKHYLQQSVIPLPPFHEMSEDGANQEPPFFLGL